MRHFRSGSGGSGWVWKMLTSALSKPLQVASPDWASLYSASLELSILGPPAKGTSWVRVLGPEQKFILFARLLAGMLLTHQRGDFLVDKAAIALLVRNGMMVRDETDQVA